MLEWRDLSKAQEAAIAAIVFGLSSLYVLVRLDGVAALLGSALMYLLPLATVKLSYSLASTEADVIARRGEPRPATHATLGLGAPPPRRLAGPQRITTVIAMMMISLTSIGIQMLPKTPHATPIQAFFPIWTFLAAAFVAFVVPRHVTRASRA